MLNEIITTIFGAGVEAIGGVGDLMSAGVGVFWDTTTSKLTDFGTMALVVAGVGLAFMAFKAVRGLLPRG